MQRPAIVTVAVVTSYIQASFGFVAGLWRMLFHPRPARPIPFHGMTAVGINMTAHVLALIIFVAIVAVEFWILYKIAQGHNWARILWLVLFLLGVLVFLLRPASFGPIGVVGFCVQAAVVLMLFDSNARPWFHRPDTSYA
jgi:hypothetical protein